MNRAAEHVCGRCNQPVSVADASDLRDVAVILLAHLALYCPADTELRRLTGAST